MEARVPAFKDQIQSQEKSLGLLGAIMKGVEQAARDMQMEQQHQIRHQQKSKRRKQEPLKLEK